MKPKNVIVWILVLAIVVLLMSTSVQAKDEVNATAILEKIENGEDIYLENVHIVGELDLSEIELKTIPNTRSEWEISFFYLEEELKIVESKIEIHDSVFEDDVDFSNTQFRKDIDFRGTSFLGKIDFLGANFAGKADFTGANFAGKPDFIYANFAGNATFNSTEFNKVSFTGATFTTVSLYESEFNQMNVEWSSLKDALIFNGPVYIKLIKKFRDREQFEDADAAYYQYRRLSQANKKWSFSKLMDVVAGVSCGYGVKPGYPLIWGFILIMLFTLVYWRGKGIKRLKENDGDNNRVSRWAAFYNAFYFSVVTFTTVGYGDWYPEDRYRIVVMIEGVLGWLLLALFIVTLANVMIRP